MYILYFDLVEQSLYKTIEQSWQILFEKQMRAKKIIRKADNMYFTAFILSLIILDTTKINTPLT